MGSLGIIGFGKTGKAVLDFCLTEKNKKNIILYNDSEIKDTQSVQFYKEKGIIFFEGEDNFNVLSRVNTVILSPGVNGKTKRFMDLKEKGIRIYSELEYAYKFTKAKIVAITGTNGKSTTTALIHHILLENGIKSILCGNIGEPIISKINQMTARSVVVVEVSSFQLEEIIEFKPDIALILNITPDHLDRYENMGDYIEAKLNIILNQTNYDYLIVNHDDQIINKNISKLGRAQKIWFGGQKTEGDWVDINKKELSIYINNIKYRLSMENNKLVGDHNLENIAAACTTALLLDVDLKGIEKSLKGFYGLKHRMQLIEKIGLVKFINDSKATNLDSAVKSIRSLKGSLIVILGGQDKGGDFKILLDELKNPWVKGIYLIGEAAFKIANHLKILSKKIKVIKDLSESVCLGFSNLKDKGGTLLLAPGCASFDMFDDFEHRGRVFEKAVRNLKNSLKND